MPPVENKNNSQDLLEIASEMASGKTENLRRLRELVVDLNLTKEARQINNTQFLALYLSKRLTGDVFENLGTDASFEFKEEKLTDFTISFGKVLQGMLSGDMEDQLMVNRLGETTRWLYKFFADLSVNPQLVFKGGKNERPQL